MIPSSFTWANNPDTKPQYAYDKSKAEGLLDSAGWTLNASGTRERDGVTLGFDLRETAGDAIQDAVAASLQEQWRKIGVTTTITGQSAAEYIDQQTSRRSYDAMLFSAAWPPDPGNISLHLHSDATAPGNFNSQMYRSPEADRLMDAAAATIDQAARKSLYFQLQDVLANDLPIAPLFDRQDVYGISPRVDGIVENLGSMSTSFSRDYMKDAWVKDGK
jgi:peptide/nickel transport system substrate-binding protein